MSGADTIRLEMPMINGEPKYTHRLHTILDINDRFEDSGICVIEVPSDEPNVQWLLQDSDVKQLNYDHPPYVIDSGTDGPIKDRSERPTYTLTRHDEDDPKGHTVYDLQEEPFTVDKTVETLSVEDAPEGVERLNSEGVYDFTDIQNVVYEYRVKGDALPLIRYNTYQHAEEGFYITFHITVADCLKGRQELWWSELVQRPREDVFEKGLTELHMIAYPDIHARLPRDAYELDDSLPDVQSDARWYTRTVDF